MITNALQTAIISGTENRILSQKERKTKNNHKISSEFDHLLSISNAIHFNMFRWRSFYLRVCASSCKYIHTHTDKRTLYIFIAQSDNIPITTCSNGVGNRQSFSNIDKPTMSNRIEISVSKPFWCASKNKINGFYGNDAVSHRMLYHHHC